MIYWAIVFLVIALLAGFFGFIALSSIAAAAIAKLIFVFSSILAVAWFLLGRRAPPES
jgi:uncharacterized membrane protein YtjA (UPF0391 family)